MRKIFIIFILICSVGLSTIHISNFQTVGSNYEPKTIFDSEDVVDHELVIWHEVVIKNDEAVSYPRLKLVAGGRVGSPYYNYKYAYTTKCQDVIIEEGINAGENKTVYFPCYGRENLGKLEIYDTYLAFYVEEGGSWVRMSSPSRPTWGYDPEQPWVGALVTSMGLNETNDRNNRFPLGYKFNMTFTVENFNPTEDLVVNISSPNYPILCSPIRDVTLTANSDNYFEMNCTIDRLADYSLAVPLVHFGDKNIHGDTAITYWWNYHVYIESGDVCGDGTAGPTENCDDPDFKGRTCETQGYDGGDLNCVGCRGINYIYCYRDLLRIDVESITTDRTSYIGGETVNILAQIKNNGNMDIPVNSYLTVKFEDMNTNQVLYSENYIFTEIFKPGDVFSDWSSFKNDENPLLNFNVSAYMYFENGTIIPNPKSTVYSPVPAGELICIETVSGAITSLECTGSGTSRQILTVSKEGGTLVSFTTIPQKALSLWEVGEDLFILIDNPQDTTFYIVLAFEGAAAIPGLNPLFAIFAMFMIVTLVWGKYVK